MKDNSQSNHNPLYGRVVAVGIPGASAASAVGKFLPGGPIHDNPAFKAYTERGRVLDPERILVASTSNFGAPRANEDEQEGSFISIDASGDDVLVIPPDFASMDGQASILDGRVQMYSAQSPAFRNGNNNPAAVTAELTGVSNPLGLSINNAFGRLWPANAPNGLEGIGTSTITDPTGIPLAGAPNPQAGGVFGGDFTPRLPEQILKGALSPGAVGTAFLGRSPDGSQKAVFCVVLADGSILQVHAAQAVDGLAPAGTVNPLLGRRDAGSEAGDNILPRLGVIVSYEPTLILYISEPFDDTIAAVELTQDNQIFRPGAVRRFQSDALNRPVDLAPAELETSDTDWASNTTLEEGADFYVANRGDNTIVRMRQDGTVAAVRQVQLQNDRGLGKARLNGIAVSPDGSRLWATMTGSLPGYENAPGALLELPAFGE